MISAPIAVSQPRAVLSMPSVNEQNYEVRAAKFGNKAKGDIEAAQSPRP
jgi:hypothetical protein